MSESEPESESPDSESTAEPPEDGSASGGEPEPESEPESGSAGEGTEERDIGATLGLFSGDRDGRRGGTGSDGDRGPSRRAAGVASSDGGAVDGTLTIRGSSDGGGSTTGTSSWSATGRVGSTDADATAGSGVDADGVVAALVAELREGSASEDELAALRRELGVERTASDDVRIEHLQARVGEFEAYAEDLRAAVDEHGSAEAFVDRFEGRLDGLRDDLEAVESELSATREAVERVEDRLEAVEAFRDEFSSVFAERDGGSD